MGEEGEVVGVYGELADGDEITGDVSVGTKG
jgi:hypothetical protein